jgi:hypothetical protein
MYDQSIQTTRTSDGGLEKEDLQARKGPVTDPWDLVTFPVTTPTPTLSQVPTEAIPHQAPEHGPDRQAALVAFAEANERQATAAEIRLLGGIADEINGDGGWAIVTAAIYEAVDSGSAFVAPKRVREIVRRWQREGFPDSIIGQETSDRSGEAPSPPRSIGQSTEVQAASQSKGESLVNSPSLHGERAQGTAPTADADRHANGNSTPNTETPAKTRNPIPETRNPIANLQPATPPPFWIDEAGIGSGQLWAALVEVLQRRGVVRAAEVQDYLKSAQLLGRTGSRGFRLGVAHDLARQRIERKWRADLEDALAELLGGSGWDLEIRVSA